MRTRNGTVLVRGGCRCYFAFRLTPEVCHYAQRLGVEALREPLHIAVGIEVRKLSAGAICVAGCVHRLREHSDHRPSATICRRDYLRTHGAEQAFQFHQHETHHFVRLRERDQPLYATLAEDAALTSADSNKRMIARIRP